MNKYELLLKEMSEYIHNIDDEILIRGYDLTKIKGLMDKAEHEA